MAEIPTIKTPVDCGCSPSGDGPSVGIHDADGEPICCDAAAYINATETALAKLSDILATGSGTDEERTRMLLRRLGLWREPT